MNDNISRITLVLIALVASAFVVKSCVGGDPGDGDRQTRDPAAETDPSTRSATAATESGQLDPNAGSETLGGDAPGGARGGDPPPGGVQGGGAGAEAAVAPMKRRDVGTPLEDGTVVKLQVPYKAGTTTRYRIENATTQRNRENDLTVFMRRFDDVTTKVTNVAEDGTARVRLTLNAIRLQAYYPNGLIIEFDSRNPDDTILDNPTTALVVKPMLALIGIPVEFQLTTNGAPIEIEGLQAWRDAWEEAVERVAPGDSREISTPFARDTVLLEWRELLFPPVVGEPLAAGTPREIELLRDTMQKAYVQFKGPMEVTHNDGDVFRVRMSAKPEMVARQGKARSPQEKAIAKVHIQSSIGGYYAAWRFNAAKGRLEDAEIEAKYQLWVSWPSGQTAGGSTAYQPVFLQMERQTRVELLSDAPDDE